MYITHVHLKDVRCFDELTIDFEKIGSSILIAGDNAEGKSTVLRSIAMGLCDESSAAALLRELPGDFVRRGSKKATIDIHLRFKPKENYKIKTEIEYLEAFEKVRQTLYKESRGNWIELEGKNEVNFPWEKIFVTSYGAGIRTQGNADYEHYFAVDAVYPLFKYDAPLQNPELAIRRLIDKARKRGGKNPKKSQAYADKMWREICVLLKIMLNLHKKTDIKLTLTGLTLRINGEDSDLGSHGDGYRATITWVVDLLAWSMLHNSTRYLANVSGIVLVDEVEQHLHPRRQLKIMHLLKKAFPKIQFIITTHSPLVISGAQEIPALLLEHGEYSKGNFSGWMAEDVFREMGLPTTRPEEQQKLIKQFEILYLRDLKRELDSAGKRQLASLRRQLKKLPGTDTTTLTTELQNLATFLRDRHG